MVLKQLDKEYVQHGWGPLTFLEQLSGMGPWLHPGGGILRDGKSVTEMALYLQVWICIVFVFFLQKFTPNSDT